MLRNGFLYWPLTLVFLALWSCRKDIDDFQPYAPTAQGLENLFTQQIPNASTQTTFIRSFLASDDILETASGIRIFLIDTDHLFALKNTGQPFLCSTCPELKIEVTEALNKSDIVARSLNTIGDSGILFESAGMIRITASCNGQELELLSDRSLKIQIPHNNQQSNFFVFAQNDTPGKVKQWNNTGQEVFEAEWPVPNGIRQGYELLVKRLGWSACGRILSDPSSLFCVELPLGFADQNTLAYVVFKNQEVVVPLQFDLGQNKFCYPKTPIGFQVKLVAVSKLGEQYWLGKAETEIGTNATYPLGTQQITEDAVLNYVKNL